MTKEYTSLLRFKSFSLLIVASIGLLAACGDRNSSNTPLTSGADAVSKAGPSQCFHAVGQLPQNDAELFAATEIGDVQRVEKSIEAGANIKATDSLMRTPLFAAAYCDHPEVASLLIDKGSDVNARDFNGMSPLHTAVVDGWDSVTKALISRGADINVRDSRGRTPLHLAAATNQAAMVELLLEHGANAQIHDKNGFSAASLAADNGHSTISAQIRKWHEKEKTSIQK